MIRGWQHIGPDQAPKGGDERGGGSLAVGKNASTDSQRRRKRVLRKDLLLRVKSTYSN